MQANAIRLYEVCVKYLLQVILEECADRGGFKMESIGCFNIQWNGAAT